MKSKLLFVTYGGSHAQILRPVVELLSKKKNLDIFVLALTKASTVFDDLDVKVLGYKDFFTSSDVINFGKKLIKDLSEVTDYEESICYMGQNFKELSDSIGEDKAWKKYRKDGRQIFFPKTALLEILDSIRPDLVVTTNSPRSEMAAVIAAKDMNIKSIAIIDMFGVRCLPWFKEPDFASKICVLSEDVKQFLIRSGINSNKLVVTGNPMFDSLVMNYQTKKKEIDGFRMNRPSTVLWASQAEPEQGGDFGKPGNPELPLKIESKLIDIFRNNSDWKLIIRNHPSESPRNYPEFIEYSDQSESIEDLLKRVDVVVTLTSTVGFQGILYGTKLITLDISVYTETMPYSEVGLSYGIDDINDLERALNDTFKDIHKETNREHFYTIDNATDRFASEITKLLQS